VLVDENNGNPWQHVSVPDVLAISNGLVLICALPSGRRFGVPFGEIGSRSEVREAGHRGILSVPRWFAEYHQLPVE